MRRALRKLYGMLRALAASPVPGRDHGPVKDAIRASGLFDAAWYTAHYGDVAGSGIDPLDHFVTLGVYEGRNPGPAFDTLWYLAENREVPSSGINPVLHYIERRGQRFVSGLPMHASQRFESFNRSIRAGLLDGTPYLGEFRNLSFGARLEASKGQVSSLPLPPVELSLRIGSPTLEGFESIGEEAKSTILRCLPPGFRFEQTRCLDFGCGIGRVIRHFEAEARVCEFWGCDIDGTSIHWANENLSPPFRFFQLSDTPVLPFEASSFDLVYALGVFSQVFIDWQCLAMEIRRILKPGGIFFMSFNGQTSFEEMFGKSYEATLKEAGMYVDHPFQTWNKGGPNVALSPDYIKTHWGAIFDIEYIAMEGFMDYQSFCLMRKPAAGLPRAAADAPVLRLGTTQDFDARATGGLQPRFDMARPFRESFGIVAQGSTQIGGWAAFRGDQLSRLEAMIDDAPIPVDPAFHVASEDYRDWGAPRVHFSFPVDLSAWAKGLHQVTVTAIGVHGTTHRMSMPLTIP